MSREANDILEKCDERTRLLCTAVCDLMFFRGAGRALARFYLSERAKLVNN